ncbi:MAG: oligosaccharide flippase family protein [Methanosarcinaceae archaeon]
MHTVQKIAKNSAIIVVGDLTTRFIGLIITIHIAKYLGVAEFGKYGFIFAYLSFFSILTDLGMRDILVRDMSRDKEMMPKLFGNAYIIRLVLSLFAVVSSIAAITFMGYPLSMVSLIYLASLQIFFISFSEFYSAIFQVNLQMKYNTFAKLIFKVICLVLIFYIIYLNGTLIHIIFALVLSESIKTLIIYFYYRKMLKPRFEIDLHVWKYLFKEMLPIALSSVMLIFYYRIDVVMLSAMKGDVPTGLYTAAYTLTEPLSIIPYAFMVSLFPIMAMSFKKSQEKLIKIYKQSFKYLLIIVVPVAIGTTIIADKIIQLIYDSSFSDSASALQILVWSVVFVFLNYVLSYLLLSTNNQKLSVVSVIICTITNIILNCMLIPMFSYVGAAVATVVASALLFITNFYFVSKCLQPLPIHKIAAKPIICGLVMGIFVYCFENLNIFILVFLAAVIYFILLIALKTFSTEDIDTVKKILKMF